MQINQNDIIESLQQTLKNKRQTHLAFQHIELATLQTIKKKLDVYIEQREKEEEEKNVALIEAKKVIDAMMEKTGLSRSDVVALLSQSAPKKTPKRLRSELKATETSEVNTSSATQKHYVYGDNHLSWNGQGDVPEGLQALIKEGFELSDFEVTHSL
ncbi:H-NS family histone-like protein [Photobacterium leiognathi]|uniref:H-NS family histone-like protein n=1 Tax=Photobacterium leiognathi TaxID=553611 RepID=UPI00298172FF|nr:H-NS family nucleoid-associated regulatory protein [Photobacterium leiognathi]